MSDPTPGCPDEEMLADLVAQALPPGVGAEVRVHLDSCDPCRETVAVLVRDRRSGSTPPIPTAKLELPAGTPPSSWPMPHALRAAERTLEPGTVFARRFEIELAAG